MSARRLEKINSQLRRLAAEFITSSISLTGTITTVTHVDTTSNLEASKFFLSVWPETKEKDVMSNLRETRSDFYEYLSRRLKIRRIPTFTFEIDKGEKARLRIEEILQKKGE